MTFLNAISDGYQHEENLRLQTSTWMKILVTRGSLLSCSDASDAATRERYVRFLRRVSVKFAWIKFVFLCILMMLLMLTLAALTGIAVVGTIVGVQTVFDTDSDAAIGPNNGTSRRRPKSRSTVLERQQWLPMFIIFAISIVAFGVVSILLALNLWIAHHSPLDGSQNRRTIIPRQTETPMRVQPAQTDLVDAILSRNATEPRDKAFAVRAILEMLIKRDLNPPDYSASLEEIYEELAGHVLEATNSLQLLIPAALTNSSRSPSPASPSWVPDWQASVEAQSFWLRPVVLSFFLDVPAEKAKPLPVKRQARNLTVSGRSLCTVSTLFKFRSTSDTFKLGEESIHHENIRTILTLLRSGSGLALFRFVTHGNSHVGLADGPIPTDFEAYHDFMFSRRRSTPADILRAFRVGSFIESPYRKFVKAIRLSRLHHSYRGAFRTHIWLCNSLARTNRCIFEAANLALDCPRSISKAYLLRVLSSYGGIRDYAAARKNSVQTVGICTGEAQVGDVAVLLVGLSLPLIIRPVGSSFRVVSPSMIESAAMGQVREPTVLKGDLEEFTFL